MKLVKQKQAERFQKSKSCEVLEYGLEDKDINLGIAIINGRFPNKGYAVNEKCKELIYVLEGKGTLNKKEGKIEFEKGDAILIDKGEPYYWDANCTIAMPCTPAWYPEQHKVIEE